MDPMDDVREDLAYFEDRVVQLEAENARIRAAARKAHDAMMDWHFAYGNPSALMSHEEAEMGEACKTIAALLDEADDASQ